MNIVIKNSQGVELGKEEDLAKFIPASLSGKTLNYGQGEGQFQVEQTIWGIYSNEDGIYTLQYEEGLINWNEFEKICSAIIAQIKESFGSHLQCCIEGKLENYESHEKYL
jgi:hypothetical protein